MPRGARALRAAPAAHGATGAHGKLARYTDPFGGARELLARPGRAGSVLVIDRDATTLGDPRLVAHLAADEPAENASLVCRHYLRDPCGRRCRPVAPEDLEIAPFREGWELEAAAEWDPERRPGGPPTAPAYGAAQGAREAPAVSERHTAAGLLETVELLDRRGHRHRLEPLDAALSIPQLRWRRHPPLGQSGMPRTESVREAIACIESYEPVRAPTVRALARHREDCGVSVAVLHAELRRIDASRIVLNRGLRLAVLRAVHTQGLSLSEIAYRCGRVKCDRKGNLSGETSWLARRIGLAPESRDGEPTPWVHSEVLALIARQGLGISPREVEL